MKFNFKQISAVVASIMLGVTGIAGAIAANYPKPFVTDHAGSFAVVYGSDAATSDQTQATNIAEQLQDMVGTASLGEEYYKFEKTSTKFHLGDNITQVISASIDDDELPTLLGEGKYIDDDNDEFDYTQKIDMGPNLQLTMFEDNDYAEDEPTVGFKVPNGVTILNYTLDFSDEPLISDLTTTDLPLMGKTYYILSNSSTSSSTYLKLTLLDSADSAVVSEGETKTISGHDVSISFISSTEVKLDVDGEVTSTLEEGETQKLADEDYVGIKDIMYVSKDTGISSVELSIGSGKLELTSESEIQINDETVSGIYAYLTNSTAAIDTSTVTLDKIVIKWDADEDTFITETSSATMPGFEIVKLYFDGLDYPAEETIQIQQGGELYATLENFPLKDGPADIDFLYATTAGTFIGIGKDGDDLLVTSNATSGTQNITFDSDTDAYFVVSWSDGSDAESYLMRCSNFVLDGSNNETDIQYYKDGSWTNAKSGAQNTDTFSLGNAELAVGNIIRTGHSVSIWNNSGNTGLNGTLYSEEGMKIHLPRHITNFTVDNSTGAWNTSVNATAFSLHMEEEDKDDAKGAGDDIYVVIGWDSSGTAEVEVSNYSTTNADATSREIDDTDVWRDFAYSELATELLFNKPSSGQKSLKVMYHGTEVEAGVYISSPESTDGGDLGDVLVTDAEVSAVQGRNLIVVGGTAVNTVAAELIDVPYPTKTDAWTAATGVGTGQLLIQSFNSPYQTGKIAVLVAGYEAADTTAGAQRLINQPSTIDTTVGNKYVYQTGTSGTSTLVSGP